MSGGELGRMRDEDKAARDYTEMWGKGGRRSDRRANIESVPSARDIVLPQTGHFAALEAPDEVARILLADAH